MTTEDELSRRLASTAETIDAEPSLDDVVERSVQKRSRSRRVGALTAVAMVMAGVGAIALAANREPRASSDRPPVVDPATTTGEVEVVDGTDVDVPTTLPEVSAMTSGPTSTAASATSPDPADPYLDQTTVVFDQVMNDDLRFVVRVSDASYGELFDIDWTAPTGSIDECLSGPALIFGDPDGERVDANEASSWSVYPLLPLSDSHPTEVVEANLTGSAAWTTTSFTSVFVVRTKLPVTSVLVDGDGITSALVEFVDGIATVEVVSALVPAEPGSGTMKTFLDQATVTMQPEPGSEVDPALLTLPLVSSDGPDLLPSDCFPPVAPQPELPLPGEQPADPAGAAATIRERFALAVDTSIPFEDKPSDLFDSSVGLEQAIDNALAGPDGDYVQAARYEIVDLVFTSPSEAWFEYDLDALGVSFRPFGRATFDAGSWQISRDTICQDLARVGVLCDPAASTETVAPPSDDTTPPPTTLNEQQQAAYYEAFACNPIRPCEAP